MSDSPSPHGSNGAGGRGDRGRFGAGNRFGRGNPMAGKASKLRSALLSRVGTKDIKEVADSLIAQAKAGDLGAIKELLNRVIGTAIALDLEERLAALEAAQQEAGNG